MSGGLEPLQRLYRLWLHDVFSLFFSFRFVTLQCVFNLSRVASFGDAGPVSALAIEMLLFLYCNVNRKINVFDNYAKQYFSCT